MKVKVSEASGVVLDWMVEIAEKMHVSQSSYQPSQKWEQGGTIIEREGVCLRQGHSGWWIAYKLDLNDNEMHMTVSPTPLIAAMRCYCIHKLGHEIEVPDELLEVS